MKSKILFAVLLLYAFSLAFNLAYSQTGNKNKSINYNPSSTEIFHKVIGADGEGIYILTSSTKGMGLKTDFHLHKYEKNTMKKIWIKDFTMPSNGYEDVMLLNKSMMLFYITYEAKNKTIDLNAKTITNKGEISDLKWAGVKTPVTGSIFTVADNKLYYTLSPDSSKLLVINKNRTNKEDESEEITTTLLNVKDFSVIGQHKLPDELNGKNLISYNFRCDNSGNLFYLCSYHEKDIENVKNYIACMPNGTDKMNSVELVLDNNATSNSGIFKRIKKYSKKSLDMNNEISFEFTGNNEVFVAGYCHENLKDAKGAKAGIFQYVVDINGMKVKSKNIQLFDQKMESRINTIANKKTGSANEDYLVNSIIKMGSNMYLLGSVISYEGFNNAGDQLIDYFDWLIFNLKPGNSINSSFFVPHYDRVWGQSVIQMPVYKTADSFTWLLTFDKSSAKETVSADGVPDEIVNSLKKGGSVFPIKFDESGLSSLSSVNAEKNENLLLKNNFVVTDTNGVVVFYISQNGIITDANYRFCLVGIK